MYYVDSQRTLTRRESSLIVDKTVSEGYDTGRTRSTSKFQSESNASIPIRVPRPYGTVRKELITSMFESMLDCIVESWEIIPPPAKPEDTSDMLNTPSEQTFASKKNKKSAKDASGKNSRTKRSRSSKLELLENQQPLYQSWWSAPDERAIIHFKNGDKYEGNISMKRMHGEGRFEWADGTVYMGQFKENEMHGKGLIQWKDDTWYEGGILGNLRHGRGLFVNSRRRASYCGDWHCGTKHGKGVIHYPSLKNHNSYDGDWEYNVRHGYGKREYNYESGYMGDWERYIREGEGFMIWPNHDFYRGSWKNGVMSGHGFYVWNAHYNNTMSLSSLGAYSGLWHKGERNGYGSLDFGLDLGSHYKGYFKDDKKHGPGKLVTNNGFIMQNKTLFTDDILGTVISNGAEDKNASPSPSMHQNLNVEPFHFDICDNGVGLIYHIQVALKNLDKESEIRSNMVEDYLENNKILKTKHVTSCVQQEFEFPVTKKDGFTLDDIIFEERSLKKALRHYETDLKNIYYYYATICNTEEIYFQPILIRLFLWQFYYDCNMHEQGLSLVEIDRLFHECPDWLSQNPHDPFEKIYFWQFLHSVTAVANKLYAKKHVPDARPDTILSSAFRIFMDKDVLPGIRGRKGFLVNGYGSVVPLKNAYELYRALGEPHTVRRFLCATRRPPHYQHPPQPALVDAPDDKTPIGRNVYTFGSEMAFITDEPMRHHNEEFDDSIEMEFRQALKLFNFGNLSSKCIIKIFSHIFPQVCNKGKIMNLDMEMTFFEFFEAFVACSQKSVRVEEEEMRWKEKYYDNNKIPHAPNPTPEATSKGHKYN